MPKNLRNFIWQESPYYVDLLDKFSRPRDVNQIISWQYITQLLEETTESAIERFIQDGALEPASLEEKLECVFQAADLKKLLKERNSKITGSKKELVQRLIFTDRAGMEKIAFDEKVMKCSKTGIDILSDFTNKKKLALASAKKQSFDALMTNDTKNAYRIYVNYEKKFVDPSYVANSNRVEEILNVMKCQPGILATVSVDDLITLKVIASMHLLWDDDPLDYLPPSDNISGLDDDRIAVNYILVNSKIAEEIASAKEYAKKGKLIFDSGDIDSCELCQTINGKIFDLDKIPDLPMVGCSSETGCQCRIEPVFDEIDDQTHLGFHGLFDDFDSEEDGGGEPVPIVKLRILKQMLDEKLISVDDYELKKAEILSKI